MSEELKNILLDKMASAYGERFQIISLKKGTGGKYGATLTCDSFAKPQIMVTFSKGLFGNKIKEMRDDYVLCARHEEIEDHVDRFVSLCIAGEYKLMYMPFSSPPTGTYSKSTPIGDIIKDLNFFDTFFLVAKEEIPKRDVEKLIYELERRRHEFGFEISAGVSDEIYNEITVAYYEDHDLEEIGSQYYCVEYDHAEKKQVISE